MKRTGVTTITIIGMGPRGLSVFERIAAVARDHAFPLQLCLVDPSFCGPGVHGPRQPQYLVLGTPASQITVFPAPGAVDVAPACVTPSLTEWARAQGYRRFDHGAGVAFHRAGDPGTDIGAEIGEDDELPRQLLGRYLGWAYGAIAASLPSRVTLQHLRHRAIDLAPQNDGSFVVELDSGFAIPSDYVFLTTGHGSRAPSDEQAWLRKFAQDHARYNSALQYVHAVYPLDVLAGIGSEAQVGILGMGLCAHDVLAELTVGRNGRFETAGPGLRYVASGQEPSMTLFSRSGLPALARGVLHTEQEALRCQFFTLEAVRDLRMLAMRQRGSAQLDFERELLPLLIKEMGFAYRRAEDAYSLERLSPDPVWYQLGEAEAQAIDTLLFPLRARTFADPGDYPAFFREHLEADLREAARGNAGSPLKAAAAVLRSARPVLQACVEHGGLLASSHRKFMNVLHGAIRRIAYGPSALRNAQLLALMDAGVLRVADTPNPIVRIDEERSQFTLHSRVDDSATVQYFDALVNARLEAFSPETDDTVFMRNLGKRGVIRPFYNGTFHPGGIDIDCDHHPLNRAGQQWRRLWVLGCLAEGARYDTHALPRPGWQSRQVIDAERCVAALFAAIAQAAPALPRPTSSGTVNAVVEQVS